MKSILVTGATGFLGKHLVEQLRLAEPDSRLKILCRSVSRWGMGAGPPQRMPALRDHLSTEARGALLTASLRDGEQSRTVSPVEGHTGRPDQGGQVEIVRGDVTTRDDLMRATEGVSE